MEARFGKAMLILGGFLIVCGLIGFLSNPAKAKTALMSGGGAGVLMLLWGFLMLRGVSWSPVAALITLSVVVLGFGWRAVIGWKAYLSGHPEKMFVAALISVMLIGAAATLALLLKNWPIRGTV